MSSCEDLDELADQAMKKRRLKGACDNCRQRKIRCDSAMKPGNHCTFCLKHHLDCTHLTPYKSQRTDRPKSYVQKLEERLAKMEILLNQLSPNTELGKIAQDDEESVKPAIALSMAHSKDPSDMTETQLVGPNCIERVDVSDLPEQFKDLAIKKIEDRFFGKHSNWYLMKIAMMAKKELAGGGNIYPPMWSSRRPEYWTSRRWELPKEEARPEYKFPEDDLLSDLIELYFIHVNVFLPLFHRPTFQADIEKKLHLRDSAFGSTVMIVCALASRFSNDLRVITEGSGSFISAGCKYFAQVQLFDGKSVNVPSVHDLQTYVIYVLFVQSSSIPQSCWRLAGIGIRLAQEVGAHRKTDRGNSVQSELRKRVFWGLLCVDRYSSAFLGRPCATYDEHLDLDLPVDCDDEYWESTNPDDAFKQPPNKPSSISFFISYLKLHEILGHAQRTILSTSKSRVPRGESVSEWEQRTVAELDSQLNEWADSIPDHLRWDPHREDMLFFDQSAYLYASYYHIQILIHRAFLPSAQKVSPMSFPSLAICANAARSCCHVLHTQSQRGAPLTMPMMHSAAQVSGLILLLNLWEGKRCGISTDPAKEMADVYKCTQLLKANEDRWHSAGRAWDTLHELAFVSQLPLPSQDLQRAQKRHREAEDQTEETASEGPSSTLAESHERTNSAFGDEISSPSFSPAGISNHEPEQRFVLSNETTFPSIPAQGFMDSPSLSNPDVFASFPADQEFYDQMSMIFASCLDQNSGLGSVFDFSPIQPPSQSIMGGSVNVDLQPSNSSHGLPSWIDNPSQF